MTQRVRAKRGPMTGSATCGPPCLPRSPDIADAHPGYNDYNDWYLTRAFDFSRPITV